MYLQTGNESDWLRTERRRIEDLARSSMRGAATSGESESMESPRRFSRQAIRQAVLRIAEAVARRATARRPYSAQP